MPSGFVTPGGGGAWVLAQIGTQATTAALAVVGVVITPANPVEIEATLSLHNMVAGDIFLIIEETLDVNGVTYREEGRQVSYDVQTSPKTRFYAKVISGGWRIRIQRTAGVDRDVTYQFYTR